MVDLTSRNFFAIAVVLYGLSAIYAFFLWRRGFQRDNRINYGLLAGAWVMHTMAMVERGFSLSRCPVNNLYEATLFVGWTIVTAYLIIGLWPRMRFLGAFAAPLLLVMGIFALMPALDAPYEDEPRFVGGWPSLHATLILLAYGAFGLASIAAAMYLSQEYNLKFNKIRALLAIMPPIQRLEAATGRLLLSGFVFLTVGLGVGIYWLKQSEGVILTDDFKIVWSFLVWGIYLVLLLMHWRFSQPGHRLAWGTVGGFAFVMLTFWGSNLLSNIHQP